MASTPKHNIKPDKFLNNTKGDYIARLRRCIDENRLSMGTGVWILDNKGYGHFYISVKGEKDKLFTKLLDMSMHGQTIVAMTLNWGPEEASNEGIKEGMVSWINFNIKDSTDGQTNITSELLDIIDRAWQINPLDVKEVGA